MIISHRKRFIFTKTVKTAGTSVESYFEKYCMREGEWSKSHSRQEQVTDEGIIGFRGSNAGKCTWYNHMPAQKVRNLIGQDIWNDYFKFTVVRNPFDKLISGFFMFEKNKRNYSSLRKIKAFAGRISRTGNPIDRITGKTEIERFRSWIRNGGMIIDRDKYLIDGKECMDYIIRFEELNEGVNHVCDQLSIPFEPDLIPTFKKGIRPDGSHIRGFYDDETEGIVRKIYAWELEKFGYDLPA